MMNISEELTAQIAQKFFFENHIVSNVFYTDNDGEKELCDILIEFIDYYVCIEVKGKDEDGGSCDKNWFKNKILKIAKKQAKNCVKSIKLDLRFYIYLKDDTKKYISIDKNKPVISLMVFHNAEFVEYDRFYFSKSLNKYINIFSYNDFCTMLNTIMIPYDIVGYLLQRTNYIPYQGGGSYIFEELTDYTTLYFLPQTEKEYAEMYMTKNYYKNGIQQEYLSLYNKFLSMVYNDYAKQLPELFETLLTADLILANKIVKNVCSIILNLQNNEWEIPFFVHSKDCGILFVRKPPIRTEEDLDIYLDNFSTYFAYKHHLSKVYLVLFITGQGDLFEIRAGFKNVDLLTYAFEFKKIEPEIDKLIRQYRSSRE